MSEIWLSPSETQLGVRARAAVLRAKKNGTLVAQPCEICGAQRVEAHHDDYSRPLDIRWLCRLHHSWLHKYGSPEPDAGERQAA